MKLQEVQKTYKPPKAILAQFKIGDDDNKDPDLKAAAGTGCNFNSWRVCGPGDGAAAPNPTPTPTPTPTSVPCGCDFSSFRVCGPNR